MSDKIIFRSGDSNKMPGTPQLDVGEPAFTTDTLALHVGDGSSNPPRFIGNNTQDVIKNKIYVNELPIATGSSGVYSVSVNDETTLEDGLVLTFIPNHNNPGNSASININSLNNTQILDSRGNNVVSNYIKGNIPHSIIYYDGNFYTLNKEPNQLEGSITFEVGNGGDFNTLNDALEYISYYSPIYENNGQGYSTFIKLLSGFVLSEQIFVKAVNMKWAIIISEDNEVTIDRSALTEIYNGEYSTFNVTDGGALPRINVLFNMNTSGSAADRSGITVSGVGSIAEISPGAGFKNCAHRGIRVSNGASASVSGADFSGAGSDGLSAFNCEVYADGVIASNCGNYGINASESSKVFAQNADLSGCTVNGAYVADNGAVNLRGANCTGAGDNGITVTGGSSVVAVNADVSNCTNNGLNVTNSSQSHSRAITADNCGSRGIRVRDSSFCSAAESSVTGNDVNIEVTSASTGEFDNATVTNATTNAVVVANSSTCNITDTDATEAGNKGIICSRGSTCHLDGSNFRTVLGADNNADINVEEGGIIAAHNATGGLNVSINTLTSSGIIFQ